MSFPRGRSGKPFPRRKQQRINTRDLTTGEKEEITKKSKHSLLLLLFLLTITCFFLNNFF
jgi:hypothetical protein